MKKFILLWLLIAFLGFGTLCIYVFGLPEFSTGDGVEYFQWVIISEETPLFGPFPW